MNAREGIKTKAAPARAVFYWLKTMNAREGIKTFGWFPERETRFGVKNNECP